MGTLKGVLVTVLVTKTTLTSMHLMYVGSYVNMLVICHYICNHFSAQLIIINVYKQKTNMITCAEFN